MHRYLQQNCNVCMEWPLKDLIASMTSMLYMPVISPQATVISPTSYSHLTHKHYSLHEGDYGWCLMSSWWRTCCFGKSSKWRNDYKVRCHRKRHLTDNVWVSNVSSEVEFPTKLKQKLGNESYRKFYSLLLPFVLFKEEQMFQKETLWHWHGNYSLLQHEGIFGFARSMRLLAFVAKSMHGF